MSDIDAFIVAPFEEWIKKQLLKVANHIVWCLLQQKDLLLLHLEPEKMKEKLALEKKLELEKTKLNNEVEKEIQLEKCMACGWSI